MLGTFCAWKVERASHFQSKQADLSRIHQCDQSQLMQIYAMKKKYVCLLQYICNMQDRSYVRASTRFVSFKCILFVPVPSHTLLYSCMTRTVFTLHLLLCWRLNQCQKQPRISCFHRRSKVEKPLQKGCHFFKQSLQSRLEHKTRWLMTVVCNVHTFHGISRKPDGADDEKVVDVAQEHKQLNEKIPCATLIYMQL